MASQSARDRRPNLAGSGDDSKSHETRDSKADEMTPGSWPRPGTNQIESTSSSLQQLLNSAELQSAVGLNHPDLHAGALEHTMQTMS